MRFNELTEEPIRDDGSLSIIKAFVDFACDRIGLERPPKIKLIRDPKLASERRSFGGYMPGGGIEITIGNRHIMDVLRTLAHEMVHHKQDVDGRLNNESGKDGSEHENEANAKAAVVMRLWGKMNPELFQKAALLAESWIREDKFAGVKNITKTGQLIPFPQGTTKVKVSDTLDWYKLGQNISNLKDADPKDYGQGPPQTVLSFGSEEEEHKFLPQLKRLGLGLTDIDEPTDENFADGKNPGRKGLSKRVGVNTKASVSTLRNVAKNSSGEKQRMAHWMANMKAGKNK